MGGTKTQQAKGIPDNAEIFTQETVLERIRLSKVTGHAQGRCQEA